MAVVDPRQRELRIIAVVCSAGGMHALMSVLAPLPPTFPAAVIVLQHQSPDFPSLLVEILARRCALPVRFAEDGVQLSAGTVFVVPPGRHAVATAAGCLALVPSDGLSPYRPSADLLLVSLARVAGARTIAVILSGRGNDGASGASAVHESGGVVIAADRATSAYFDMPAAAIRRKGTVDHVLPVTEIANWLEALVSNELREASPEAVHGSDEEERDEADGVVEAMSQHRGPQSPVAVAQGAPRDAVDRHDEHADETLLAVHPSEQH